MKPRIDEIGRFLIVTILKRLRNCEHKAFTIFDFSPLLIARKKAV